MAAAIWRFMALLCLQPIPDGMAQRRDVQIINVAHVRLHVLRAVLLA
jgi:hypothetical protein